jgi:hypothetical protein
LNAGYLRIFSVEISDLYNALMQRKTRKKESDVKAIIICIRNGKRKELHCCAEAPLGADSTEENSIDVRSPKYFSLSLSLF